MTTGTPASPGPSCPHPAQPPGPAVDQARTTPALTRFFVSTATRRVVAHPSDADLARDYRELLAQMPERLEDLARLVPASRTGIQALMRATGCSKWMAAERLRIATADIVAAEASSRQEPGRFLARVVAYDAAADRPRFGPDGLATLGRGRLAFAETAAWFAPWENLCHLGGDPDLLQEFVGFTTGPTGRYRSHASVLLIDQSRFLTGAEGSRSLATRDRVIAIGWSQLRAFAGAYELNAFLDRDALARGFHPDRATWYRAHQTHAAHAVGWFYDAIGSRPYRQRPTEAYRAVCARLGTMQIDDPPALLARYLGERAIGANALFRGDGVTSRADGSPGALEYLIVTRNDLRAHPDGSWVVVDASRRIEDPPTAT